MAGRQVPCVICQKALGNDEIALSVKFSGLSAPRLLCLSCQAEASGTSVDELQDLIEFYKGTGCAHFQRDYLA